MTAAPVRPAAAAMTTRDEPMYWEPWTPEPGQRVRIRLSGECREQWSDDCVPGHPDWMDGRTGVIGTESREDWPGTSDEAWARHRFPVVFDKLGPDYSWAALLAAIELEPVS